MNKIALGLIICQGVFTLADFSPYRSKCNRFGKFETRIQGKNVTITSTERKDFLHGTFTQDRVITSYAIRVTELYVGSIIFIYMLF